jgi:hypothetical protein|nr:MAG TPA: hypothetical protein [Caudoviricetes sp.]
MIITTRSVGHNTSIRQLEYIQSSKSQYIKTGVIASSDIRVVIVAQFMDSGSSAWVFGARSGTSASDKFTILRANDLNAIRSDFGSQNENTGENPGGQFTIDKNRNVTTIGNTTVTSDAEIFSGLEMYLFAGNTNGSTTDPAALRLYSCKIYDDDVLVRDYVPAKDDSGVVCLFDFVMREYVYNSGTGSFSAGPEI